MKTTAALFVVLFGTLGFACAAPETEEESGSSSEAVTVGDCFAKFNAASAEFAACVKEASGGVARPTPGVPGAPPSVPPGGSSSNCQSGYQTVGDHLECTTEGKKGTTCGRADCYATCRVCK